MTSSITLRKPTATDGYAVNQLIKQCPPLDTNSAYCNLLQCSHFSDTSVIAIASNEQGNNVVGFISGYILPRSATSTNTLFVWQVAISEQARGQGLASQLVQQQLQQANQANTAPIEYIETTITEANQGSWALFTRLAEGLGAKLEKSPHFERDSHFNGAHDTEFLVRIGPITP
jgi:L-2,4-diaminobutyric acid acetyltransferase